MQLLLYGSFCDWEYKVTPADAISQTVVFDILLNDQRHGEHSALACFLLHHFQTIAVTIPDNIARPQFQNIADPQAQVALQY